MTYYNVTDTTTGLEQAVNGYYKYSLANNYQNKLGCSLHKKQALSMGRFLCMLYFKCKMLLR